MKNKRPKLLKQNTTYGLKSLQIEEHFTII